MVGGLISVILDNKHRVRTWRSTGGRSVYVSTWTDAGNHILGEKIAKSRPLAERNHADLIQQALSAEERSRNY